MKNNIITTPDAATVALHAAHQTAAVNAMVAIAEAYTPHAEQQGIAELRLSLYSAHIDGHGRTHPGTWGFSGYIGTKGTDGRFQSAFGETPAEAFIGLVKAHHRKLAHDRAQAAAILEFYKGGAL